MELATFGNIVFETSAEKVRTWQKFQRQGKARFAVHPLVGRKPRLEFLGPGLDTLNLQIDLNAQLGLNPTAELEAFRTIKNSGQEQLLVVAGQPVAKFVIENMGEDHVRHGKGGVLLLAKVDLQLKEYADD